MALPKWPDRSLIVHTDVLLDLYMIWYNLQETLEDIDKDKDGFISEEEYIGK